METNAPNLQWDNVCMMNNSRMETQEGLNASSFFFKKKYCEYVNWKNELGGIKKITMVFCGKNWTIALHVEDPYHFL